VSIRRLLVLGLLLTGMAFGQATVNGGQSRKGGWKNELLPVPPPPVGECILPDVSDRTLISGCGVYPGGKYYLNGDLTGTGTCLSVTGAGFDLAMQGHKITFSTDPTLAHITYTNKTITVGTANTQILPRPTVNTSDSLWATVIEISDSFTCSDGTTKVEGVNYRLEYNYPHGKLGGGDNNRGFTWQSGKPATDGSVTCTIPSYKVALPRYGVFNSGNGAYGRNTGNTVGGGANMKIACGTIEPGAATPNPFSMGIFNELMTAPVIEDMTVNMKGWSAPAIGMSYTSGPTVKRTTVNCDAAVGSVFYRDYFQGYCIWNYNTQTGGGNLPGTFQNVKVTDSMHGGIHSAQSGSDISGNQFGPLHQRFTNGFAIIGSGSNIYDNDIDFFDPVDFSIGGRGIYCQWGAHCYNNRVLITGSTANIEYGGCEIGGTYAMQSENTHGARSDHNELVGVARDCTVNARRFTQFGTSLTDKATGYFEFDNLRAFKFADTSPGQAIGLLLNKAFDDTTNTVGGLGADSLIEADLYNVKLELGSVVTLNRVTFVKGSTTPKYICGNPANAGVGFCSHPSASYATFRLEPYNADSSITLIDPIFLNGASATSISGVLDTSYYTVYHLWTKWTRTFTVTSGGNPVINAQVTLTDVSGGQYSGFTNGSGLVTLVVPQYHSYNTASVAVNTAVLNPYVLSITKTGCDSITQTGVNYTAPGSSSHPMTCQSSSIANETTNNTSASTSFTAIGWTNDTEPASNVSKESVKEYLYPGFNGKVFAHIVAWWGTPQHQDIYYTSNTTEQANLMVADMKSRQIDGIMHDWYGNGTNSENVAQKVVTASVLAGNFVYVTQIDVGAFSCSTSVECANDLIDHMTYLDGAGRFNSSAYYKINSRPVVMFFSQPSAGIDWATVNANATVQALNPYWILQNESAFTNANAHGGFSWVTDTFSDPDGWGQAYLQSFYTKAKQNPTKFAFGSTKPGFDDTEASWGTNRILERDCGDTWLQTWNIINTNYSSTTPLYGVQLVTWDDYEEGSSIETGIDSCITVSATVNSSAVSWTIPAGTLEAIHHFKLFYSLDNGTTLHPLVDNVNAALRTYSIAGLGFNAGTKFYVKMIGKSMFINKLSNAATL
jgi:hypothetical protein